MNILIFVYIDEIWIYRLYPTVALMKYYVCKLRFRPSLQETNERRGRGEGRGARARIAPGENAKVSRESSAVSHGQDHAPAPPGTGKSQTIPTVDSCALRCVE